MSAKPVHFPPSFPNIAMEATPKRFAACSRGIHGRLERNPRAKHLNRLLNV